MLCIGTLGGIALVAAIGATLCVAAIATSGVLARRAGDWTVPVTPVRGWTSEANVAGLVRLATSPLGRHVLDGRTFTTRRGPVKFGRDGRALLVRCAPCRVQHDRLASTTIALPRAELRLEPRRGTGGNTLDGSMVAGDVTASFVAQLQASGVTIDWTLPETPAAHIVQLLGDTVPEARHASIEGSLAASGRLHLPSRRRTIHLEPRALAVDGLATELLQHGTVPFSCTAADGRQRASTTGDGERSWRTVETLGTMPAAIAAASELRANAGAIAHPLTRQLARSLYVAPPGTASVAPTLSARVRVALYAIEMERTLSRERILTLTLNTAAWGPGVCGARAAARTYFRKTPAQLSPLESAWLASILDDPAAAWRQQFVMRQPDAAGALRVLGQMHDLTRAERQRWSARPLVLAPPPATRASLIATSR